MGRSDELHGALAAIHGWPAQRAAAALVGPDGPVASVGPVDDPFPLASVTKLISAVAVLVAVEEGSVTLDDPAGPPGATVAHLLAHAGGLGPDGAVLAAPGTRRIYSNAGYERLGDVVAAATGMPFDRYAAEAVTGPLGMRSAPTGSPAHGAAASVADLARLAGELLGAGDVLAPSTLGTATAVAFPGLDGILPGFGPQRPNDWGLGPEVRGSKSPHWTGRGNSAGTFGHFGRSGTFLWVDPAAGCALVVLTDEPFGPWAVEAWPALSDAVLATWQASRP